MPRSEDKWALDLGVVERTWFQITCQEAEGWIQAREPAAKGNRGDLIEWNAQLVKGLKDDQKGKGGLIDGLKRTYDGGMEQALSAAHLDSMLDLVGGSASKLDLDSETASADAKGPNPIQVGEANKTFMLMFQIIDRSEARTLNAIEITNGFKMVEQFWDGIEQLYPRSNRLHKQPSGVLPISSQDVKDTLLTCTLQLANEKRGQNLPLTAHFCEEWKKLDNSDILTYPPENKGHRHRHHHADKDKEHSGDMSPNGTPRAGTPTTPTISSPTRGHRSRVDDKHCTLWIGHLPAECVNQEDRSTSDMGTVFGIRQLAEFLAVGGNEPPKLEACVREEKRMSWCLAHYEDKEQADEILRAHAEAPIRVTDAEGNQVPLAIKPAESPGQLQYQRIVDVLTDSYFKRVVLPALQSWTQMFEAFSLERNGTLSYASLKQGLTAACSHEVGIIDSGETLDQIMGCMVFTVRAKGLRSQLKDLVFDRRDDARHRYYKRAQKGAAAAQRNRNVAIGMSNLPLMIHSHKTAMKAILENDRDTKDFSSFQATFHSFLDFKISPEDFKSIGADGTFTARKGNGSANGGKRLTRKVMATDDAIVANRDQFEETFKSELVSLLNHKRLEGSHEIPRDFIKHEQLFVSKLLPPGWNAGSEDSDDLTLARAEFSVSLRTPEQVEQFLDKFQTARTSRKDLSIGTRAKAKLSEKTMGDPVRQEARHSLDRVVDAMKACQLVVRENDLTAMGDAVYSLRLALTRLQRHLRQAKERINHPQSGKKPIGDFRMHSVDYVCNCDYCERKRLEERGFHDDSQADETSAPSLFEQLGERATKDILLSALEGLNAVMVKCVGTCTRMLTIDTALKAPLREGQATALAESTFGHSLQRMLMRRRLWLIAKVGNFESTGTQRKSPSKRKYSRDGMKHLPKLAHVQAMARGSIVRRWYKRNTVRRGIFCIKSTDPTRTGVYTEVAASMLACDRTKGTSDAQTGQFKFDSHHYDALNAEDDCFPSKDMVLKFGVDVEISMSGLSELGGFRPQHRWKANLKPVFKPRWAPESYAIKDQDLSIDYIAWPTVLLAYMNIKMLRSSRGTDHSKETSDDGSPRSATYSVRRLDQFDKSDLGGEKDADEKYEIIDALPLFRHLEPVFKAKLASKMQAVQVSSDDMRSSMAKKELPGLVELLQTIGEKRQQLDPKRELNTIRDCLWLDDYMRHDKYKKDAVLKLKDSRSQDTKYLYAGKTSTKIVSHAPLSTRRFVASLCYRRGLFLSIQ